jgi:hypothetical protein
MILFDTFPAEPFLDGKAARWGDANAHPANPAGYSLSDWLTRKAEMRGIIALQIATIEPQARDLGLWPGTQGPEIEVYLPGMTVGVDEPVLTPGGYVPSGSTVVLRAPGKVIRYFAQPSFPDFTPDPKLSAAGRSEGMGGTSILIPNNVPFIFTIKARTYDPVLGYSGLSELQIKPQ